MVRSDMVRSDTPKMLLQLLNSQAISGVRTSVDWTHRVVDRVVGQAFVTGRTAADSVATHDYKFCGKTRSLGLTSTTVDIAGPMP
jgi:hypothetical protein